MERTVRAELLDSLPPEDSQARGSRDDLLRLNAWMGNARAAARALQTAIHNRKPKTLADLGAGDGRFALRVAQSLPASWKSTHLLMVDQQATVSADTHRGFERMGWTSKAVRADVLQWMEESTLDAGGTMMANLFLHHFTDPQLRRLFVSASRRARVFVAVEPRRSPWALFFSLLVGCIGCNRVTRHDAPVSVRAGFTGRELSSLWPADEGWDLTERPVGWFGHLFMARNLQPT